MASPESSGAVRVRALTVPAFGLTLPCEGVPVDDDDDDDVVGEMVDGTFGEQPREIPFEELAATVHRVFDVGEHEVERLVREIMERRRRGGVADVIPLFPPPRVRGSGDDETAPPTA